MALSRKTGAGALKLPAPAILGLRPDGKKEIRRPAKAESAVERFFEDLYVRRPTGEGPEMVDGG